MVRIALDSNVLVYAELEPESEKGIRAHDLIVRGALDAVIPVQAIGEFLNVVRRKKFDALSTAILQTHKYRRVIKTPVTTLEVAMVAIELAAERKLQFWDSVICVAAAQAGATVLFSEDMQDGADIRGLRIVNPFDAKNDAAIGKILSA
jgi:predicted nucleic acid-binding protein